MIVVEYSLMLMQKDDQVKTEMGFVGFESILTLYQAIVYIDEENDWGITCSFGTIRMVMTMM